MLKIAVFHFGADEGRMGISSAYALGVEEDGSVWRAFDKVPGECCSVLAEFVEVRFLRAPSMDGSYPMQRLLDGKGPFDFKAGDFVDAGMGNWGTCAGVLEDALEISQEQADLEIEEEKRAVERVSGVCRACQGEGKRLAGWSQANGHSWMECERCSGMKVPAWLRAQKEAELLSGAMGRQPAAGKPGFFGRVIAALGFGGNAGGRRL